MLANMYVNSMNLEGYRFDFNLSNNIRRSAIENRSSEKK